MIEIAIGIGFQNGISLATLEQAIESLLKPLGPVVVRCLASHRQKADEPALHELARIHGWPLRFYQSSALAQVPVAHVSERVRLALGTPSVAEAAALLAAAELKGLAMCGRETRAPLPGREAPAPARGPNANPNDPGAGCMVPTLLVPKRIYRGAGGKAIALAVAQIPR